MIASRAIGNHVFGAAIQPHFLFAMFNVLTTISLWEVVGGCVL